MLLSRCCDQDIMFQNTITARISRELVDLSPNSIGVMATVYPRDHSMAGAVVIINVQIFPFLLTFLDCEAHRSTIRSAGVLCKLFYQRLSYSPCAAYISTQPKYSPFAYTLRLFDDFLLSSSRQSCPGLIDGKCHCLSRLGQCS